ncbi:MAG: YggT family protein [Candidatus Kaiserbacteria bacterium]|nr:YggT family protein [Candidatus Kaiserbacteria bacterium]
MAELLIDRGYYPSTFVYRLINGLIGIIESAFALRLVLELFGASPSSQFVGLVYGITDGLIGPFAGAFPNFSLGGGFVINITVILAMIGYAILGWLIIKLLSFIFMSGGP